MRKITQHARRESSRLRLGIDARFEGFDGTQLVILHDLSATGAKVLLEYDRPISKGILIWMDYEAFGDLAWRRGRWCGIQFDEAISEEWLINTRALAPTLEQAAKDQLLRDAEEFVTGQERDVLACEPAQRMRSEWPPSPNKAPSSNKESGPA